MIVSLEDNDGCRRTYRHNYSTKGNDDQMSKEESILINTAITRPSSNLRQNSCRVAQDVLVLYWLHRREGVYVRRRYVCWHPVGDESSVLYFAGFTHAHGSFIALRVSVRQIRETKYNFMTMKEGSECMHQRLVSTFIAVLRICVALTSMHRSHIEQCEVRGGRNNLHDRQYFMCTTPERVEMNFTEQSAGSYRCECEQRWAEVHSRRRRRRLSCRRKLVFVWTDECRNSHWSAPFSWTADRYPSEREKAWVVSERSGTYGIHECGEDEISAEEDKQDTVSDEDERERRQESGNLGQNTYPVGERRNQEKKPRRQGWKTFGRAELLFASLAAFRGFTRFDIRQMRWRCHHWPTRHWR